MVSILNNECALSCLSMISWRWMKSINDSEKCPKQHKAYFKENVKTKARIATLWAYEPIASVCPEYMIQWGAMVDEVTTSYWLVKNSDGVELPEHVPRSSVLHSFADQMLLKIDTSRNHVEMPRLCLHCEAKASRHLFEYFASLCTNNHSSIQKHHITNHTKLYFFTVVVHT